MELRIARSMDHRLRVEHQRRVALVWRNSTFDARSVRRNRGWMWSTMEFAHDDDGWRRVIVAIGTRLRIAIQVLAIEVVSKRREEPQITLEEGKSLIHSIW